MVALIITTASLSVTFDQMNDFQNIYKYFRFLSSLLTKSIDILNILWYNEK